MSDSQNTDTTEETTESTPTEQVATAEETWPKTETLAEADGTRVIVSYKDGSSYFTKTYTDGSIEDNKEVDTNDKPFIVRRYLNGDIHYRAPSGMVVEIKCGDGADVMKARRNVGKSFDEEAFLIALMANLCKINGSAVPYEIYAKQFNIFEFMAHMQYFKERNF